MKVRAGEEPGAEAGGTQDRFKDRRGRALAFAAGDMDRGAAVLRIAQATQDRTDSVEGEVGFGASRSGASLEVGERHQPIDRTRVVADRIAGIESC